MVEWNIIFNQDNVPNVHESAVIQDDAQSEGESQKIIQAPLNNTNNKTEKPDNELLNYIILHIDYIHTQ